MRVKFRINEGWFWNKVNHWGSSTEDFSPDKIYWLKIGKLYQVRSGFDYYDYYDLWYKKGE